MIVTMTDFGVQGPYLAQMKAVLAHLAPGVSVLDLFTDAPAFNPRSSAYLLAAYAPDFPAGSVFLCVVDPGVGTERGALAVRAQGRWFVGPDNGLLLPTAKRDPAAQAWRIAWRPERLSATFHGRDLFAPVAARLACGDSPPGPEVEIPALVGADWPEDLAEVVYVDVYGNAMTGLRAATLPKHGELHVDGQRLRYARTFADAPRGGAFWYENANGLVEIAVNQGRADRALSLAPGTPVRPVASA